MAILFVILQLTMLCVQAYALFRGFKNGDMFSKEALYGCGIWGMIPVLTLGAIATAFGGA